jgi:hypothetical protein
MLAAWTWIAPLRPLTAKSFAALLAARSLPVPIVYRIDGVWLEVLRVLHERRDISADLIGDAKKPD